MFEIREDNNPKSRGPTIELTRGDSASFVIEVTDYYGEPYELQDGDTITFTVKKNTRTDDIVFQKVGTVVSIEHEDTKRCKYGTYVYDVQLSNDTSGNVDTFIGPANFIVSDEVTFNGR